MISADLPLEDVFFYVQYDDLDPEAKLVTPKSRELKRINRDKEVIEEKFKELEKTERWKNETEKDIY